MTRTPTVDPLFIVVFREHNKMHIDTLYIGPFPTFDDAYDHLCTIPALGIHDEAGLPGVKYVQCLDFSYTEGLVNRANQDSWDGINAYPEMEMG